MFKIDCSVFPGVVTDFGFDHLADDIENSSVLDLNYANQTVFVDSGDMELAYDIRDALQSRFIERLTDMRRENERGYETELSESEIHTFSSKAHRNDTIQISSE